MSWIKEDFDKCKVNVLKIPEDRNCLKENEWLGKVFVPFIGKEELENLKGISINQIVRMIVLCYDINSPMVVRVPDIKERRIEAFKLLEIKTYKNGRFSEDADKIIIGRNETVNRMILQYLKVIDNLAYSSITYYTESYYDLLGQLSTQDPKDKAQTMLLIDKIEEQLKKKSMKVFLGDEGMIDYVASEKIYEEAAALSPEAMAKKLRSIKDTIDD